MSAVLPDLRSTTRLSHLPQVPTVGFLSLPDRVERLGSAVILVSAGGSIGAGG